MKKTLLVLSLIAVGFLPWCAGLLDGQAGSTGGQREIAIYDRSVGDLEQKVVLISKDEFTWDRILTRGNNYLHSRPPNNRFAELIVAYDEPDLRRSYLGTFVKSEHEASIADTLLELRGGASETGMPETGIARVLALGNSALLTYREEGTPTARRPGTRELVLGGGSDPTWVKLPNGSYRLLHIALKNGADRGIAVFFRSEGHASCSSCLELARLFKGELAAGTIDVEIRPDNWFASPYFPLVYRFASDTDPSAYSDLNGRLVPPSVSQFYRLQHISCSLLTQSRSRCESYGLLERQP